VTPDARREAAAALRGLLSLLAPRAAPAHYREDPRVERARRALERLECEMSREWWREARRLREAGVPLTEVARRLGRSKQAVWHALNADRVRERRRAAYAARRDSERRSDS